MGSKWTPRLFFGCHPNAAYELENNMYRERRAEHVFVLVDPAKIPNASFHYDDDYPDGVWTSTHVPPEAIIGFEEPDADYPESDEFLRYMGVLDNDDDD